MQNTELYHREATDKYTFEFERTPSSYSLKLAYRFSKIEYILNLVYDELPEVVRFSFESLDEIYEALVLQRNHKVSQDGIVSLRVEITKKGEVVEKWLNLSLRRIEEEVQLEESVKTEAPLPEIKAEEPIE